MPINPKLSGNWSDGYALDYHILSSYFTVTTGELSAIKSKAALETATAFEKKTQETKKTTAAVNTSLRYDLVGKIALETGLTRRTIASILKGIRSETFSLFTQNPEEFILKTANIINEQKATVIVEHIEYKLLEERYDTSIFTEPSLKTKLDANAVPLKKHLFDYLISDSQVERSFAKELETQTDVTVYVKLPSSFYITTPVGNYNPDWAIAFREDSVKHIYFVAETKGSLDTLELREAESAKIACAKKHFEKIGTAPETRTSGTPRLVLYDKVDNYTTLLEKVMK